MSAAQQPTGNTSQSAAVLRIGTLVERIERYQKDLKLSDVQFVARFQRYLGSTRTWRERLCAREIKDLLPTLDKWVGKLDAFVLEIDGGSAAETFYDAMPIAAYSRTVYEILQGERSDRRCAWLIGPTGVGKSEALRRVVALHRNKAVFVTANETWKDSRMQIARGLASALGAAEGNSAADTFRNVIVALTLNPVTICLDEMHEGGVLLMKLIKSIINETRAKVIVGIYPTSWNRLVNGSTDATAEAQQLLGRSLKPVDKRWVRGLTLADIATYIECAAGINGHSKIVAERIYPEVLRSGNLRILAPAIELARVNADENGEEMDAEMIEEAVRKLSPNAGH